MPILSSQHAELLVPAINHFVPLGMSQVMPMRDMIYNVQATTLETLYGVGLGGMSPDQWNLYSESGGAVKGELKQDQLFKTGYTQVEYPATLTIETKLLRGDQYSLMQIQQLLTRVGMSAGQQMEIKAASLFANAFSSGSPQADGVALCSSAHPLSPQATGAGTTANAGAASLTVDAVSDTRIKMRRFPDDKGNKLGIVGNELWVPPERENDASVINTTAQSPGNANNDDNPEQGRYSIKVLDQVDDVNNWFMASAAWRKQLVNWYNRSVIANDIKIVNDTTTHITFEFLMEYAFGSEDWRWIFGHEVA